MSDDDTSQQSDSTSENVIETLPGYGDSVHTLRSEGREQGFRSMSLCFAL